MKESTKEAVIMSKELLTTVELVHKAIKKLEEKNYSHMQEYCIEINKLENKMDRVFRDALGHLFDEIKDPILVINGKRYMNISKMHLINVRMSLIYWNP